MLSNFFLPTDSLFNIQSRSIDDVINYHLFPGSQQDVQIREISIPLRLNTIGSFDNLFLAASSKNFCCCGQWNLFIGCSERGLMG
jgi:hypothetical protein